jgi:hypothetical protein
MGSHWCDVCSPVVAISVTLKKRLIPLGFEPRLIDPESIVLPLHHGIAGANLSDFGGACKPTCEAGNARPGMTISGEF